MIACEAVWKRDSARPTSAADGLLEPGFEPVHRKLVADDAGRGDQDLSGSAAQSAAAASAAVRRAFSIALAPGRRVGVARVDHDGPDVVGRQQLPVTTAPARRRPGWS